MADEPRDEIGIPEEPTPTEVPGSPIRESAGAEFDDYELGKVVGEEDGGVPVFSAKQLRRARDVLARLYGLRRSCRFYPPNHPAVVAGAQELVSALAAYHEEGVDVPFAFFEEEVLLGEQLLTEESVLFDQLIRDMVGIGVGTVVFLRGLTPAEIIAAIPVFASDPAHMRAAGGLQALAQTLEIPHIKLGEVTVVREETVVDQSEDSELAKASYMGALDLMRELEHLIVVRQSIPVQHVKGTVRSLVDSVLGNRYAMLELSGLKHHDEYTFYHSVNVAILSLALGSMISKDYRFLASLGVGALLHDIGKITVGSEVLNKAGSLDAEEWAEVQQHPVYGAETAARTPGLDKAAVVVILEHHMRYDSTGYPVRVPPRPQHVMSRIVAVSDAFDAMTSQRSYSAPRLQDEAIAILVRNSGSALDPVLVRMFVNLMGVYPPRSVVRLTTDEVAVVLRPSEFDALSPVVRVIADDSGRMVEPFDLDLSDASAAGGRAVSRCLDPRGLNVDVQDYL